MKRIAMILVLIGFGASLVGCQAGGWRCRSCYQTGGPSEFAALDHCGCGITNCDGCTVGCDTAPGSISGCHGCGGARSPFDHLRQLFSRAACGAGCGEKYWGEWTSDPPDCCDPCDSCGIFTGIRSGCSPRPLLSALGQALRGVRHGHGCDCTDCTTGHVEWGTMETIPEELQAMPPAIAPPGPATDPTTSTIQSRRNTTAGRPTNTILIDERKIGTGSRGVSRR